MRNQNDFTESSFYPCSLDVAEPRPGPGSVTPLELGCQLTTPHPCCLPWEAPPAVPGARRPVQHLSPSSQVMLPTPLCGLIEEMYWVFSNESTLHIRWPKYWSFSFNISPSNEHPGLISFRMDWLDLLAVLGTLKSLLQHHKSKASILWPSAFFMVQFSHPYRTTGKLHL